MNKRKIALMCMENFVEPLKKENYEVFWTLPLFYSLLRKESSAVSLNLQGFGKRLDLYKNKIVEFNPDYFLAEQWYIFNSLNLVKNSDKRRVSRLWIDFINVLNTRGVVTAILCVDDPRAFSDKTIRAITHAFQIVKTTSMQMEAQYRKYGQKVSRHSYHVTIDIMRNGETLPDLSSKEVQENPDFKFDVFFVGVMNQKRRVFYRSLSRKIGDLDFFFGNKDFFYTSRKNLGFYPPNHGYIMAIYRNSPISVIYGNTSDLPFRRSWMVTDRVFEIPYCRGFFLSDYRKHLVDLFDVDPKLYTFKTVSECHEKVRFYLENRDLREQLAKEFHAQVMQHYTVDKVAVKLIDDIRKLAG